MMNKTLKICLVLLLIATGVALRLLYVFPVVLPDGDTAAVGLLALDILEGRDFPVYPPLAHYGGTLISYLGALFFKMFGVSALAFRMVGVLYSCLWGLFAYLLARKAIGFPGALFASLFLVLPPYGVLSCSLWTTGVYAETFIFVSLLLWLLCQWNDAAAPRLSMYLGLGFLSGLGLWTTPWTLPILLTIGTVFFIRRKCLTRKEVVLFVLAFMLGYLPAIIYNFQHPGAQLLRFGGRVLDLDRSALSSPGLLGIVAEKVLWRLSTVPASVARIPMLLVSSVGGLNAAVFFAGLYAVYRSRVREALRQKRLSAAAVILIFVLWFCVFYVTLVGEKETRFVAPLLSLFAVFSGALCAFLYKRSRALCLILLAALVLNNSFDLWQSLSRRYLPGYKALSSWLRSQGVSYGYSGYDTSCQVMFETQRKIVMSPTLFHLSLKDRWPQQTAEIRKKDAVFVINSRQVPHAESLLDRGLKELGVSYVKNAVEEYLVYGDFSRRVFPEEVDFSVGQP